MPEKYDLTVKELDILNLIARGYPNRQIAEELNTTEQTIKNSVSSILLKLKASNRTEAVTKAMYNGLIFLDIPENGRSV
jgi:DNA-binding NarL/FixJ family response regulator